MMETALRVSDEASRGLVRLSRDTMNALGLSAGATIAVEAGTRTHGRVIPAEITDGVAEVDPWLARNAGYAGSGTARMMAVELPRLDALVLRSTNETGLTADRLKDGLFDMAMSVGDRFAIAGPTVPGAELEVIETSPGPAGIVTDVTVLTLKSEPDRSSGYERLGGLDDEIARVHEMIAAPLLRPELFERLGLAAPRGVLFSGPPGSGKTLLARAVAARTEAAFFHINAPEIVSKHYGDSEAALRKTFAAAEKASPAIVFIDEIDAIAPARSALSGEKQVERRIVAQLLTLLDGLTDRGRVVVMAATNLPEAIDPALRRPGRFDREIRFRPPNEVGRAEILRVHLSKAPLAPDVDLGMIARSTHGYVGADLAALAREAAVAALNRSVEAAGSEAAVDIDALEVTQADLMAGLEATGPSALREDEPEAAHVNWSDVGGLEAVKSALETSLFAPLEHPDIFAEFGVGMARGVLLSGPPGTGKTLLARALAAKAGMNFLPVRPPRILSQFFGEAERGVADLFKRARQTAPTLLFFDEFDSLAPRRGGDTGVVDRVIGQLLVELDGLDANRDVVVLAATNRPSAIDPALLRPGRFDVLVHVGLPDRADRLAILEVHLGSRPTAADVDLDGLAAATDGFSGADLAEIVRSAARAAAFRAITMRGPRGISGADLNLARASIAEARRRQGEDHLKWEPV